MNTPELPSPNCTSMCEPVERWVGGVLLSRRWVHRHGPADWGGYDADTLGLGCSHADEDTCAGLRRRDELTKLVTS